jgi:hypothetical protein
LFFTTKMLTKVAIGTPPVIAPTKHDPINRTKIGCAKRLKQRYAVVEMLRRCITT